MTLSKFCIESKIVTRKVNSPQGGCVNRGVFVYLFEMSDDIEEVIKLNKELVYCTLKGQ